MFCNLHNCLVPETVLCIAPASKRIPALYHCSEWSYIILQRSVLVIYMIFILDYGGNDFCLRKHLIHLLLRVIIGNADRTDLAVFYALFHSLIDRLVVGTGLMDQHQVKICQA